MPKHFALYHSAYFTRRGEIFIGLLAISASFCLPAIGQEHKVWQSDLLPANSNASETDTQQIYGILLKMLDRWNAHDIEGYMGVYCRSPELLVVVDAEQSLTAGSNFMIPTLMGIRIALRWDSSNPASKSSF